MRALICFLGRWLVGIPLLLMSVQWLYEWNNIDVMASDFITRCLNQYFPGSPDADGQHWLETPSSMWIHFGYLFFSLLQIVGSCLILCNFRIRLGVTLVLLCYLPFLAFHLCPLSGIVTYYEQQPDRALLRMSLLGALFLLAVMGNNAGSGQQASFRDSRSKAEREMTVLGDDD